MPIPNPVAFTIFHIDIMWYGILITAGIALATIVCMRRAPKHGLDGDRILNFVIISVPVAIVGARLYYVIFNWSGSGSSVHCSGAGYRKVGKLFQF